jgi:hypothetical protein
MILKLFSDSIICILMIGLDSLFEVTLIYSMLNGTGYQAEESRAQHSCNVIYG